MELRELGNLILALADDMERLSTVDTPEGFRLVTDRLGRVQAMVPNRMVVIEARVAWYKHGLNSFEQYFVVPTEEGRLDAAGFNQGFAGLPNSAPGLIIDPAMIPNYLTPRHIGENTEIIARVVALLERVLRAKGHEDRIVWIKYLEAVRRATNQRN